MKLKKGLKILLFLLLIFLAIIGLHKLLLNIQYASMAKYANEFESKNEYTEITKFNKNGGEPLFLVNKKNNLTIFFMEGFRTQNPAGMYRDWLDFLHEKQNINIVVPVYGIQSSPFYLRNRQWHFEEDLREIIQIYEAYTTNLPENHKIIVVSQSFGALPNSFICLEAKRKPDLVVFLSPLNSFMEYKAAGPIVYWLSKQTSWLRYIFLFTKPSAAPNRKSVWDIVNDEKNLYYAENFPINPEDSAELGYKSQKAAVFMEKNILPLIKNLTIFVAWGDQDLYFSQKGFENFVNILSSQNKVESLKLDNSGHMVLLDNGEKILKEKLLSLIISLKK
jgi:pimeloyl-ACP methyl ester carboxylesterase